MLRFGVCLTLGLALCLCSTWGCGGGRGTEAGKGGKIEKVETQAYVPEEGEKPQK
jgi:hypothetical protein